MRARPIAVAMLTTLSLVGCGSTDNSDGIRTSEARVRSDARELKISQIESTFANVALVDAKNKAAIPLGRESKYPPVSVKQEAEVDRGADDLIRLCRADPTATYGDKTDREGIRTLRQVLEDDVATVRKFQPDTAERLETVANNGCE